MSARKGSEEMIDGSRRGPEACVTWAALLPDAVEGLLGDAEQGALQRHIVTCVGCAREYEDAQRGAAWLHMLKDHAPEPPADLLSSILAKTSGAEAQSLHASGAAGSLHTTGALLDASGAWTGVLAGGTAEGFAEKIGRWLGLQGAFSPVLQPRLAMTAAMAFLSICLTLNLLGISVRDLHAESLHPTAGLQRTVADTGASLVRSFEGIRVVYRLESRVNEWRTASTATAPPLRADQ